MTILLQQKNFSTNVIYFVVGHESFIEEAIEVEDRRGLWLGGSWRYIAGGLCRGREAEEEERRRGREKSRNLTTPHRRGGEKQTDAP